MHPTMPSTTPALTASGVARDTPRRLAERGDWRRLARGLYLPHARPPTEFDLASAVLHYAGRPALLTGRIAARALGMRWIPAVERAQALVPAETRRRAHPLFGVRRTSRFAELEPWTWSGLPVAPPERVVLDAALSACALRDARGIVMAAIEDRWTTAEGLRALLQHEPRNGTGLLRSAIRDSEAGAASPPEAELVDALRGCGLPFLANPELRRGEVRIGFPDGYFVGLGAGWEVESRERHEGAESFDTTLRRHTIFAGHGVALAHVTPRQIRADGHGTAAAVLAVSRARLLLPAAVREPADLLVIPRGPLLQ